MTLARLAEDGLDKYGEYVALAFAFVLVKDGPRVFGEEIAAFCETRLARFKSPKHIRFVDSLPKSPIGKILRKELRTQV